MNNFGANTASCIAVENFEQQQCRVHNEVGAQKIGLVLMDISLMFLFDLDSKHLRILRIFDILQ